MSQRASSEPLRLTVAILTVVVLSAFLSEFPQAASVRPATVAIAATPNHFFDFHDSFSFKNDTVIVSHTLFDLANCY